MDCERCLHLISARLDREIGPDELAELQGHLDSCPDCRAGMRERLAGEAREVETTEYVPKMNVTPNAVALKDD